MEMLTECYWKLSLKILAICPPSILPLSHFKSNHPTLSLGKHKLKHRINLPIKPFQHQHFNGTNQKLNTSLAKTKIQKILRHRQLLDGSWFNSY